MTLDFLRAEQLKARHRARPRCSRLREGLKLCCTYLCAFLLDTCALPWHICRSFRGNALTPNSESEAGSCYETTESLAWGSEREVLTKVCRFMFDGEVKIKFQAIVNFVVWRRSLIVLLASLCTGSFLLSLLGDLGMQRHFPFVAVKQHLFGQSECSGLNSDTDFEVVKDQLDSGALVYDVKFAVGFFQSLTCTMGEQLSKADWIRLLILTSGKGVTASLLLRASFLWADWSQSKQYLMWAWIVNICVPVLQTILPTAGILVEWGPIDRLLEGFQKTTIEHFKVKEQLRALADRANQTCEGKEVESYIDSSLDTVTTSSEYVCSWVYCLHSGPLWAWLRWSTGVDQFLELRLGEATGAPIEHVDSRLDMSVLEVCDDLTHLIELGDTNSNLAKEEKMKLCTHIHDGVDVARDFVNLASTLNALFDEFWRFVREILQEVVSAKAGIISFITLLPLALSIAPGLLSAALRIKTLVPDSFLPGVFILIMPLLYVPLTWSLLLFLVQSIRDPVLLVGVVLMAFSPLVYTFMAIRYDINYLTAPGDARIFVRRSNLAMTAVRVLSIVCFCFWADRSYRNNQEFAHIFLRGVCKVFLENLLPKFAVLRDYLWALLYSAPVWSMVFTCVAQYGLTAAVASDWTLRASAEEFDALTTNKQRTERAGGPRRSQSALFTAVCEKRKRMDAMLSLTESKQSVSENLYSSVRRDAMSETCRRSQLPKDAGVSDTESSACDTACESSASDGDASVGIRALKRP